MAALYCHPEVFALNKWEIKKDPDISVEATKVGAIGFFTYAKTLLLLPLKTG